MVEVMISVVILTLCCGLLTSTLGATRIQRITLQEQSTAVEAARGVIDSRLNSYGLGARGLL